MKTPIFLSAPKNLIIIMAGIMLIASEQSMASQNILESYDLGGGDFFFVDPVSQESKSNTVDFFNAQCDHYEVSDNKSSTTHTVTLTLQSCEKTQIQGVKAHPISGDMVVDTFEGISKFNRETKGDSKIINGDLYQAGALRTMVIGEEVVDTSSFTGTSEDFKKISEAQLKIEKLKQLCEEVKKQKITQALGNDGLKANQIINALSSRTDMNMEIRPALEENRDKCVLNYSGKVILNQTKN
ncbi:MAG: hypothetical protein ACXVCY_07925 [Pseudobdellovibrionaceae bacterium]